MHWGQLSVYLSKAQELIAVQIVGSSGDGCFMPGRVRLLGAKQEAIMALLEVPQQKPSPQSFDNGTPIDRMPPAGPHDRPELTNFDACPGAGALPPQSRVGAESDPGAG
jgi:hypothetical protein